MRILVTGGAGYIGSVLTGLLLEAGHEVVVVDRFFFGPTLAHLEGRGGFEKVRADIRWMDPAVFEGIDAVCDLAALSNDPAGELDPDKTMEINFAGRARVANLARENGVGRYVLASSCSIYGFQGGLLDESSAPNPLTTYARANLEAERAVAELADSSFTVTTLRQATVYGLSRRMRFDLAINGMTLGLYQNGKIPVLRDGQQWRPMVHVKDTSQAFITVLQAPPDLVQGQIFNVGSADQNYQILPLAELVANATGLPFRYEWYGEPDDRSYQVSFDKIGDVLGYKTRYGPADAAPEILQALDQGQVQADSRTRTVEWYKLLLQWQGTMAEVLLNGRLL